MYKMTPYNPWNSCEIVLLGSDCIGMEAFSFSRLHCILSILTKSDLKPWEFGIFLETLWVAATCLLSMSNKVFFNDKTTPSQYSERIQRREPANSVHVACYKVRGVTNVGSKVKGKHTPRNNYCRWCQKWKLSGKDLKRKKTAEYAWQAHRKDKSVQTGTRWHLIDGPYPSRLWSATTQFMDYPDDLTTVP